MKLLPFDDYEMLKHPDKLLSIVGGAALGGFGLAFLVQLLVRGWTGKQVPRWALMSLRVGGGVGSGWLVALWILGGGGWGLGDSGGFSFGTSNGHENSAAVKDRQVSVHKDDDFTKEVQALYVEVLGESVLDKLGESKAEPMHCYRIETTTGKRQLMTRKEVADYMKERLTQEPPLKAVTIVLYDDSPSLLVQRVLDLKYDAQGLNLSVGEERRKYNAPLD